MDGFLFMLYSEHCRHGYWLNFRDDILPAPVIPLQLLSICENLNHDNNLQAITVNRLIFHVLNKIVAETKNVA